MMVTMKCWQLRDMRLDMEAAGARHTARRRLQGLSMAHCGLGRVRVQKVRAQSR